MQHVDPEKEWGALGSHALIPIAINYEPKINSGAVQGEKTGDGARQESGTSNGGAGIVGESQGGGNSIWTVNRVAVLSSRLGQVEVPAESRAGISAHSFWKRGTTAMFDIRIFNIGAVSYLHMTP